MRHALLGVTVAAIAWSMAPVGASAAAGWLAVVNAYRASAGLPAVTEDGSQSAGDLAHATYMVQNNTGGHSEDPSRPGFTAAGAAAAQQSNVLTTSTAGTTDEAAVAMWMVSPFHSVGIIDPNLTSTGFGSARAGGPGIQMGAALNVIAGRAGAPRVPGVVMWPGDGANVPLTTYPGNEAPDPLTACPGFVAPTGLPIVLEAGSSAVVGATSISDGATVLDSCEFDGTNYVNPVAADQANGRAILAARGAVILVPRSPLSPGHHYAVSETVNATTYSWSFGAGSTGLPTAAASRPTAPESARRPAPAPAITRNAAPAAPRAAPPTPVALASPTTLVAAAEPVSLRESDGGGERGATGALSLSADPTRTGSAGWMAPAAVVLFLMAAVGVATLRLLRRG